MADENPKFDFDDAIMPVLAMRFLGEDIRPTIKLLEYMTGCNLMPPGGIECLIEYDDDYSYNLFGDAIEVCKPALLEQFQILKSSEQRYMENCEPALDEAQSRGDLDVYLVIADQWLREEKQKLPEELRAGFTVKKLPPGTFEAVRKEIGLSSDPTPKAHRFH